jgi:ferrochelatase
MVRLLYYAGLSNLNEKGIDELIVLPLYPQFSKTTTEPVRDRVKKALSKLKFRNKWHFINEYCENYDYIFALKKQIEERWAEEQQKPALLLFSYHGIPLSYVEKGDPYRKQCAQTTKALKSALASHDVDIVVSYQSRVTSEEWLKPYTEDSLKDFPEQGIKNIEVCCPGFSADCLETIDEIGVEYQKLFLENGGENYFSYPALNSREAHIELMKNLVKSQLKKQG